MSKIVSCPNCGQKNRINDNSDSSQAICAKCWTKLDVPKKTVQAPPLPKEPYTPPPPSKNDNTKCSESGFGVVWLLVIVVFIWWVVEPYSENNTESSVPSKSYPKSAPSYPELAMPYNGEIQMYTNDEGVAPFKIQTSAGANYLVKLVSAYSQQPVMTVFVRGGNTVSTEVPLGTYEVKYASGGKWYGYEHLFGPDTGYSKAESLFTFENTGYQITGYTITLYRVSNGNLRTSTISPSQF